MLKVWWTAIRPTSVIKVVLPVLVGLAIGFRQTHVVRPDLIGLALLFAWLDQLVIILLNDYADARADTLHTKKFPALIDARAVPNGWLKRGHLLVAGAVSAAAMVGVCALLALRFERPYAPGLALGALFLIWVYSFPPIRLNYRGMGEILETVGVGGVLPFAGFYLYTGSLDLPLVSVAPLLCLALSSAVMSGIKHLPADRETGKKSIAVLFGDSAGRAIILVGLGLGIVTSALLVWMGYVNRFAIILTVLLPSLHGAVCLIYVREATHENLDVLGKFKRTLQNAIYVMSIGLALGFAFR